MVQKKRSAIAQVLESFSRLATKATGSSSAFLLASLVILNLGDHWSDISFLRYVAACHQHRNDSCYISHGVSDPAFPEQGCDGDAPQIE
jgi:hypothetical protein